MAAEVRIMASLVGNGCEIRHQLYLLCCSPAVGFASSVYEADRESEDFIKLPKMAGGE